MEQKQETGTCKLEDQNKQMTGGLFASSCFLQPFLDRTV
jgi:hypothetical protein